MGHGYNLLVWIIAKSNVKIHNLASLANFIVQRRLAWYISLISLDVWLKWKRIEISINPMQVAFHLCEITKWWMSIGKYDSINLASVVLSIWQKILWNSWLRMLKSKRFIRTYQVVQIYSKTNSLILIDATMWRISRLCKTWVMRPRSCIHCDGMYQHKSKGCWNLTLACQQG
jgi:hypothetical protein